MPDAFNGARLESLRYIHGLTQRELGSRIGLTQSQLSRIERGDIVLAEEVARTASVEFGEPLSFFRVMPTVSTAGPVAFRRRSDMRASERDRVSELFREASRVFAAVSERSAYREFDAFIHAAGGSPDEAAAAIRSEVGLGARQPVRNVTRLIERIGVGVVANLDDDLPEEARSDVSGITIPSALNVRPLVATLSIGRGDAQRLTIAHELGHLVLDRHSPTVSCSTRSPQEKAAFALARALLLPPVVVRERVTEASTLKHLLDLKLEYGVSVGAIVYHARRLAVITEDRARTLQIQISSRGWRDREPIHVEPEKPVLLRQALTKVYPSGTYARASHDLGVHPARLLRWSNADAGTSQANEDVKNVTSIIGREQHRRFGG